MSGYDGDGAAALCGIKEVGGITIAQKLDTAGQPDMPQSAIDSGCIDFVLSPEEIAREIQRITESSIAARHWRAWEQAFGVMSGCLAERAREGISHRFRQDPPWRAPARRPSVDFEGIQRRARLYR